MYQRELPPSAGRRRTRRSARGPRGLVLPGVMLLFAAAAFLMAFTLPPSPDAPRQPESGPALSPVSLWELRGEEPVLPPAEEPVLPEEPGAADWQLTLVNPWTPLPDGYEPPELKQLSNGHAVDQRCYPDLQDMMDACRAAGNSPLICSSYRSQEKQESLYQNKVDRLTALGYDASAAKTEAAKAVALPGTSEHQLGLAVDIVDVNNQNLDESQEDTAVQKWLMEHSWQYGFILRYPNDKSEVTGIIYEPWHYRYVGREAAREIHEQGVCLEEYLDAA